MQHKARSLLFLAAFPLATLAQTVAFTPSLDAGQQAYKRSDFAEALKHIQPLADQGNAAAQVTLGTMNLRGQGVPRDPAQALKWYLSAAGQDNTEGEFYAGSMYLMGAGIPHDTELGLKWLGKAAKDGSSDAQVMLGLAHLQGGGGVTKDLVQADMWLHLAAARGDPLAKGKVEEVDRQLTAEQLSKAKALVAEWQSQAK